MARCRVDSSIERVVMDGFAFPLGVYPVEPMTPRAGYTVWFEPADGEEAAEDDEELEEWPDRYVFDIAITATRVEALCRALLTLLPGRLYPILDVLGHDAYREVDPYVSYDLIGQDRFMDAIRRFRGFFFEDGLVGFGAMSEEPFVYIFVDEHKQVTVRVETSLKERVEEILATFDLEEVEETAGADAATHEHRGVLDAPPDRPDLLTQEEIVEELIDEWGLVLNVPPEGNVDEEGNELGITGWRVIVRWDAEGDVPASRGREPPARRYAEVILSAGSLRAAEDLASEAVRGLIPPEVVDEGIETFVVMERVRPEDLAAVLAARGGAEAGGSAGESGGRGAATASTGESPSGEPAGFAPPEPPLEEEKVWRVRWMD